MAVLLGVLEPTQMLVLVSSKTPKPVVPMRFSSQLTLAIPPRQSRHWTNPKGKNGETSG
jgi:hypothetical protein